jgi:hypothetical protein
MPVPDKSNVPHSPGCLSRMSFRRMRSGAILSSDSPFQLYVIFMRCDTSILAAYDGNIATEIAARLLEANFLNQVSVSSTHVALRDCSGDFNLYAISPEALSWSTASRPDHTTACDFLNILQHQLMRSTGDKQGGAHDECRTFSQTFISSLK